jgi:hypothetical protein
MPTAIQTGGKLGMQSMDQSLTRLVMEKIVSPDEAKRFQRDLASNVGGRGVGMPAPAPGAATAPGPGGGSKLAKPPGKSTRTGSSGVRPRRANPYL